MAMMEKINVLVFFGLGVFRNFHEKIAGDGILVSVL